MAQSIRGNAAVPDPTCLVGRGRECGPCRALGGDRFDPCAGGGARMAATFVAMSAVRLMGAW